MTKKYVKRRVDDRYAVNDATVSVIKEHYTKMGQLMDISKGGLSFRYVDSGDGRDEFPQKSELSIVLSHNGFHLDGLRFITISDQELKPEFMEMRKRSVRFRQVPEDQSAHLEYLLSNLTSGVVKDNRSGSDRRQSRLYAIKSNDNERRSGKDRRKIQVKSIS